jgi:hypothetical protein
VEPPCLAIMQPADSARPERVDTERLRSSMCGRPDYYIPNIVDLVGFHNDILYTMSTSLYLSSVAAALSSYGTRWSYEHYRALTSLAVPDHFPYKPPRKANAFMVNT